MERGIGIYNTAIEQLRRHNGAERRNNYKEGIRTAPDIELFSESINVKHAS